MVQWKPSKTTGGLLRCAFCYCCLRKSVCTKTTTCRAVDMARVDRKLRNAKFGSSSLWAESKVIGKQTRREKTVAIEIFSVRS